MVRYLFYTIGDLTYQSPLVLEMQSDSTLRAKYLEVGISGFFSYLPANFKNFRKFATRIMAMFGSTYVCEHLFSFMRKTSQRTRLTDQHLSSLIKVGTAQTFQPDIPKIVIEKRCQASGQNTKNNWIVINKCSFWTVVIFVQCICCCCILVMLPFKISFFFFFFC